MWIKSAVLYLESVFKNIILATSSHIYFANLAISVAGNSTCHSLKHLRVSSGGDCEVRRSGDRQTSTTKR